jgi:hypothetical protein
MKIVNIILSEIKLTCCIIIVLLLLLTRFGHFINNLSAIQSPNQKWNYTQFFTQPVDKFGVKEIYPTKTYGREWYISMHNPQADKILIIDNDTLVKENDGSWRIGSTEGENGNDREFNGKFHIIIGVNTPPAQEQWKNVEITGYVKVIATSDYSNSLQWYARGANHTEEAPCEGTSLKGRIYVDGNVGWIKEIWHDGGYTEERATSTATDKPLIGRWIGWKVVIYNINNDTAVKMESYLDDNNNNQWRKVTEFTDRGGWYADTRDKVFYRAHCGYPKDYIITNSGPIASFRSDGIAWDFKNLSVREIQSPVDTVKTNSNSKNTTTALIQ